MDISMLFVSFLILTIPAITLQNGFHYYKALNRTPISRMERFYEGGLHKTFKVPLPMNKRIIDLYGERLIEDRAEIPQPKPLENDELLSFLVNKLPSKFKPKSDDTRPVERNMQKCLETQNIFLDDD